MYDAKSHKTEYRVVSFHLPWIRPMLRDMAAANVEFGGKIPISMSDSYSMSENVDWEEYNEEGDV